MFGSRESSCYNEKNKQTKKRLTAGPCLLVMYTEKLVEKLHSILVGKIAAIKKINKQRPDRWTTDQSCIVQHNTQACSGGDDDAIPPRGGL